MDIELGNGDGGQELLQAQAHIMNHMLNFISSMSLKCAVQLGIPEVIHNHHQKPITLSELVKTLGIPEEKSMYVYRLMGILVHSGFFAIMGVYEIEERQQEGYVLTLSSKLLLKSHPMSMSPYLLMSLHQDLITPWHFLSDWYRRTDHDMVTPFQATYGFSTWKYFGENQETGKLFHEAMACDAYLVMSIVLNECKTNFEGLRSVVDVGGGTGTAARAISEAFPGVKCTVLDQPQVIGSLQGSENLEYVGGDMLEYIPSANAVLLKYILHDWSDDECLKILKRCRQVIPPKEQGGKVIIIDMVLDDSKSKGNYELAETKLFFDLVMMVIQTGLERTEIEWEKLFLDSGFTSCKITPVLGIRSFIEVFPWLNSTQGRTQDFSRGGAK